MSATPVDSLAALLWGLSLASVAIVYVWTALALASLFRKLGEDPWRGWVPLLNQATVLRWGGFSPWLILVALVPGAGTLAVIALLTVAAHRINPGFGYGGGMTAVAAFAFPVWASVLGFGSARWLGRRPGRHRVGAPEVPERPAPALRIVGDLHDVGQDPAETSDELPISGELPQTPPVSRIIPLPPPAEPISVVPGRPPGPATPQTRPVPAQPPVQPPVQSVPAPVEPAAPDGRRPAGRPEEELWAPHEDAEEFPEHSIEISAVAGSPAAGAPVAAADVAADELDQTVMARRRRPAWQLVPASGAGIDLVADVVIVGRMPEPHPAFPDAQLVALDDQTRTVSKTHARLERHGESWQVVDLESTNGVVVAMPGSAAAEIEPGVAIAVHESFTLGDVELRLVRARTDGRV